MRVIDYKRTHGNFTGKFVNDNEEITLSINEGPDSISGEAELAKKVIDNEEGNILEIVSILHGVVETEKFKLIKKNIEPIYRDINEDYFDFNDYIIYKQKGFVNIKMIDKLDDDCIHFLFYYKSVEYKINGTPSNLIINALKKGPKCCDCYNSCGYVNEYEKIKAIFIKHFIKRFHLLEEDYLFCIVPSHEQCMNNDNPLVYLINDIVDDNHNATQYLHRYRTIKEQKYEKFRRIETHLDSVSLNNKINVNGKKIIIIDDITTSGSSLLACKKILLNAGAEKVICFAFGKAV